MKLPFLRRILSPRLNMQGKIFIAFGLAALLSIVSVTSIIYMNMRETIKDNAVTSVLDSIRQADESANIMLQEIDRLNTVVVTNKYAVIDTILSPSEEISYEWFQEQKLITGFLSGLIDYKPYITRIAVVGLNGKVFFSGGPWLDRTFLETPMMDYMLNNGSRHAYFKPQGSADAITVGREIRYDREAIGVVMVDLNYDFIKKTYGVKPTEDSLLYVLDEQNGFVYQTEPTSTGAPGQETLVKLKHQFAGQGDAAEKTIGGRSYIVVSRQSAYTGWTTLALIPTDSLLSESARIRNLMIEVSVVVFIVVLFVSLQMSSRTTIHIRRLKSMMSRVKEGNLDFPRTEIKSKDEIGELNQVFIGMVEELKSLMEDIRMSEREKREAELTALQAQIRPHFLYNSLNTIKYLAKLNGVPNIEEASGALIELMRGVLGNSNEFLTVREELDYVFSYVAIEKYKFLAPIRVETQVEDESLLECRVLKLMLQPLVENAIIHGVGPSEQGGVVLIRVYEEQEILKIEVTDNGQGMTKERMEILLGQPGTEEKPSRFSGMGVSNVHERIHRMYGDPYGVKLYSEPGLYTKAEIWFPRLPDTENNPKEVLSHVPSAAS
ncbi:sensor histidine kinase [Cohnella thailandensis]|uniref:Sensor histidine kinase n=1 Tax=Cohnella thailandensis TaxID=557557 RepID=A0A841SWY8_9BACL|nr:sensor histidine kinase [Cohnella thailandensis]MBB6634655.1 sensor histidine kinase [Cohnella thailandensis]MBP1972789.1 two-component system sensor histidine kinase YesM [Cohnella thailandensis]